MARSETVYEALAFYGAPLVGVRPVRSLPLEELLPRALEVAPEDATILRSLPLVIARNREHIDWSLLHAESVRVGQVAATGMLLEMTAKLLDDGDLERHAAAFAVPTAEPTHFFRPRGPFDERLARSRTPAIARKWGFWMNMPEESFRSHLEKHRG